MNILNNIHSLCFNSSSQMIIFSCVLLSVVCKIKLYHHFRKSYIKFRKHTILEYCSPFTPITIVRRHFHQKLYPTRCVLNPLPSLSNRITHENSPPPKKKITRQHVCRSGTETNTVSRYYPYF